MTTYFPIVIKIIKSKRYNICWFIRSLPNLQYKQKYQQGWCFIWYRKKEHPCWLLLVFLAVMTDLNKSMKLMLKLLMIFVIKSGHKANKEHKSDFKTSWNILNTVINKGTRTKQPKLFKEKEGINSKYIADRNSARLCCLTLPVWAQLNDLRPGGHSKNTELLHLRALKS